MKILGINVQKIENVPNDKLITCILPLRISGDRADAIDRLDFALLDNVQQSNVGFLVIDDGSSRTYAKNIEDKCKQLGYGYAKLDTELSEFSIGRCRNFGAMLAKSKYIFFQDIDLMPYLNFYRDLEDEITIQKLDSNARDFLMCAYVFLTKEGTELFLSTPIEQRHKLFLHYALTNDANIVEKFSTGTSANLYNRIYYLARGGNDTEFEGWGYEDLEFNTRCVRLCKKFPLPRDWQVNVGNFANNIEYKGWKSAYRLFGDLTYSKGLVLFHAWHPVNSKSSYIGKAERNRKTFERKMGDFVKYGSEPEALPSVCHGKSLLFRTNPFVAQREFLPKMGQVVYENEEIFETKELFRKFLADTGISRVVFHNPYANEKMTAIYHWCRDSKIPFLICERGGLNNSFFFDDTGFLAESKKFDSSYWDCSLSQNERQFIIDYICAEKSSNTSLEDQPVSRGHASLRRKLGINSSDKVLFVALQRPSDAATKFFPGYLGDYDAFIQFINDISFMLPRNWKMVVKKHPLEDSYPEFYCSSIIKCESHFKDLFEVSDAVLTFNSGLGLLALMWELPVFLGGRAFYSHSQLNHQIRDKDEFLTTLLSGLKPEKEMILRFFHYLVNQYYSFGEFVTKKAKLPDGSNITATTDIKVRVIRGLGEEHVLEDRAKPLIGWESYLFDRYRMDEKLQRNNVKASEGEQLVYPEKKSPLLKRLKKLRKNPKQFFLDSKLLAWAK